MGMLNRIQVFIGRVFTLDAEDLKREEGQTVTEYGVVLGVLIVALGGVVFILKGEIQTFIEAVGDKLELILS
jgi:Flp pilus assembly pilin Flp